MILNYLPLPFAIFLETSFAAFANIVGLALAMTCMALLNSKWMRALVFCLIGLIVNTLPVSGQSAAAIKKLDGNLKREFADSFGYSVVVANDRKIQFDNSYGFIDSLKSKRTNRRTLFNIASVTKSFTAVGIMRLKEQGKLKLTDTLGVFFENVPNDKRRISISQLLSHQSGLQQNYVCMGVSNSAKALKLILSDSLDSIPGSTFMYSNENYELLALIIEKVSHLTYEQFIRNEILRPLKMSDTFFWDEVTEKKNMAEKKMTLADSLLVRNWDYIGSGGVYSTAIDLYKFIIAVVCGKLVSSEGRDFLFSEGYKMRNGLIIGHGWFSYPTTEWNSREIYTRGNEDWGHNAVVGWFPERNTYIIVCTNSGELGNENNLGNKLVRNFIAKTLFEK